ncbi:MAG TPA: small acid-soluble spore protein H [Brevibacillus sp.]|nr:small acid-soluble spore protein H [Brevibacillus sp.]
MNTQRAKEIVNSPVMTRVTYNEVPVYIQHIDEETEMARIFPLNEPEREQSVPVGSLVEER